MPDPAEKKLFCTAQQMSLLQERTGVRPHLSGERFWQDRHPEMAEKREEEPAWQVIDRDMLAQELTAKGAFKRLAVVCAAGLGKSTNLLWLAKELAAAGAHQAPFFFELDDPDLPDNVWDFWRRTLPAQVRKASGNSGLSDDRLLPMLDRMRARGRITLLLDSIDQAGKEGLRLLHELLSCADWAGCPIVVSARPHAIFDQWDRLIGQHEGDWRFVRVEPLAEQERQKLLRQDGVDRYGPLPPGGKELMANPRNIEYVRKCAPPDGLRRREPDSLDAYTLRDLRTASHVFAGAVNHMVRYGMRNPKARKLGRAKDRTPPDEPSNRQIEFALDLLGALAYSMYCLPAPGSQRGEERPGPNVSHVPAKRMTSFEEAVLKRIKAAGLVDRDYRIEDLEDDLDCLAELNAEIKFDLLDTRPHRYGDFRWYDRSLQEFFAAWWLSRYAGPRDHERLRVWRYDDPRDETGRTLYQPLWGFLVEMPRAVRRTKVWTPAVGVLFEHNVPRCCEMIYRAWRTMSKTTAGRAVIRRWRQEFEEVLGGAGPRGEAARSICDGFRRCPMDPAEDGKAFLMGSPKGEKNRRDSEFQHPVVLSPFAMHEHPVTNAQYELFDPTHEAERWGYPGNFAAHPAGKESGNHPAVNVSWYQAWCFAQWTGNRLPSEAEWEYSCRGGAVSYQVFHYGNTLSHRQANFDGRYPYGDAEKSADYLKCTTPVGSYEKNRFGLYDMHGNVWEWCEDWYDDGFYETKRAKRSDPVNRKAASARVLRGGSWDDSGGYCRSAYRSGNEPGVRYHDFGFRLAAVPASLEPSTASQEAERSDRSGAGVVPGSATLRSRSELGFQNRDTYTKYHYLDIAIGTNDPS